jgi:hypothetical protein
MTQGEKAALYTGGAYIITVILLVLPYLIVPQTASGLREPRITLLIAVGIIAGFNFYVRWPGARPSSRASSRCRHQLGVHSSPSRRAVVRSVFGSE